MNRYAIFFPQYHRITANDLAWGHGFTDWVLVAAANAFGYWQRRAPACGFYDLSRDDDTQGRFDAAARAGLDGFGIYHYRFDDGPELDAVERFLAQGGSPRNFAYFYIWANENWTTRWVGSNIRILKELSARPSREAIIKHVNYLSPFMDSQAYARVGDRPLFVIYHPDHFTEPEAILTLYREAFRDAGIEPRIGFFVKNAYEMRHSCYFDFCYLFEPRLFFNFQGVRKNQSIIKGYRKLTSRISPRLMEACSEGVTRLLNRTSAHYTFSDFLRYFTSAARKTFVRSSECSVQEIVTCGWNNAPRYRHRSTRLDVPTAEEFSSMMSMLSNSQTRKDEIPLLCNAWNEWCEGAAIEPCSYLGDALLASYLETAKGVYK
ncbi:MAG: glycoside hydrolase family 99-like domain-containing protein [Nitrososphaerota archaeon]|nr:glycoside hydrolase family 99-like domain-containing protein [Nitrososphaerota archaeon]